MMIYNPNEIADELIVQIELFFFAFEIRFSEPKNNVAWVEFYYFFPGNFVQPCCTGINVQISNAVLQKIQVMVFKISPFIMVIEVVHHKDKKQNINIVAMILHIISSLGKNFIC